MPTKYAELGYEAYAKSTAGKTWDGRDMPKWADLPPNIVKAWEAAAAAIAHEHARDVAGIVEDLPITERNA